METTIDFSTGKFKISRFLAAWGVWAIGSFITCAIAIVTSLGLINLFPLNEDHWFGPFFLSLFGLFAGGLQALILARRIPRSGWWIPVSIGGWLAILPVVWLLSRLVPSKATTNPSLLLIFAIIGTVTGFSQWLFLHRHWRYAIWWIPASLAGAVAVGLVFGPVVTSMVELSLIGLIPFSVTGLMVGWLFVDPLMRKR
jgi:hypothetical protein